MNLEDKQGEVLAGLRARAVVLRREVGVKEGYMHRRIEEIEQNPTEWTVKGAARAVEAYGIARFQLRAVTTRIDELKS